MLTVIASRLTRARRQGGFGLVELLIAMNVLVIGILALFAMFQAGIIQIRRASTVSTSIALAEAEMENFRALRYDSLGLVQSEVDAISAEDPYKLDEAYPSSNLVALPRCGTPPCTDAYATLTKTGADGRQYRVDTFMAWQTVSNGRNVKLITIVVRDTQDPTKALARVVSSFDESTGL